MILQTPPGAGGVAVVVAQAPSDRARLAACLRTPDGGLCCVRAGAAPRRAILGWAGVDRDDVLVVDRGARGLEVHLHGSPALLAEFALWFGPLVEAPARPAERLLRTALSTAQLQLAVEQWHVDFAAFLAATAAEPEERRGAIVAAARARSRAALALATPARLVLAGRQNAGKSTLFNRLLFRERALTGAYPGLTRDPIADVTCLDGYPYELVDTAGEGPAASLVDAAAIARGRALRTGLVLCVVDGSVGPTAADRELAASAIAVVATRADRASGPWPAGVPLDLCVDARDSAAAATLRASLGVVLRERRGLPPAGRVGGPAALDAGQWSALEQLPSAGQAGSA